MSKKKNRSKKNGRSSEINWKYQKFSRGIFEIFAAPFGLTAEQLMNPIAGMKAKQRKGYKKFLKRKAEEMKKLRRKNARFAKKLAASMFTAALFLMVSCESFVGGSVVGSGSYGYNESHSTPAGRVEYSEGLLVKSVSDFSVYGVDNPSEIDSIVVNYQYDFVDQILHVRAETFTFYKSGKISYWSDGVITGGVF